MFADGLIYRGKRLVNWDTHLQTAVSDDEVYHETVKGHLWHIRYPVKGQAGRFMTVATTRPETMLGDTAVAVHPDDPRYKDLVGKTVVLPLMDREIPVIADGILVDPKFGTGCVKVTPAHDPNDYEVGLRHQLEMINILTPDGHINANGGPYQGLDRLEGPREGRRRPGGAGPAGEDRAVRDRGRPLRPLEDADRAVPVGAVVRAGWRDLAETAMEAVRDGRVKFHPDRYARTYLDWLGVSATGASRGNSGGGTRFRCGRPPADVTCRPQCSGSSAGRSGRLMADRTTRATASVVQCRTEEDGRIRYVCRARRDSPEVEAHLRPHGLSRDPDVLDTWFSSALWPLSTLGWPEETPDLKAFYPTDVLVTAREIITLWVARMVMMGLYNVGRGAVHGCVYPCDDPGRRRPADEEEPRQRRRPAGDHRTRTGPTPCGSPWRG